MKLKEKGKIQAPPIFDNFAELTSQAVQALPNIISVAHWDLYQPNIVDGADFYLKEEEIGHIHLSGEVHLATNQELKVKLIEKDLAKVFEYGGGVYDGWVQFTILSEEDAQRAIWLFKLNYDRLKGLSEQELIDRINDYEK